MLNKLMFLFLITILVHIFVPVDAISEECSYSYPTVCIPEPPPDLDCAQISYRNFRVLQPDPHGFDGDRDGIGCEIY